MGTNLILSHSKVQGKRYVVKVYQDGDFMRSINFGSSEHENYTMHKDIVRKRRYIDRHEKHEDWTKINAGSLSRYLLWNKPTLTASVKDFQRRFGVTITVNNT
jgi:hypothetical protein